VRLSDTKTIVYSNNCTAINETFIKKNLFEVLSKDKNMSFFEIFEIFVTVVKKIFRWQLNSNKINIFKFKSEVFNINLLDMRIDSEKNDKFQYEFLNTIFFIFSYILKTITNSRYLNKNEWITNLFQRSSLY